MKSVLKVYVARHCLGTAEATRLAAEVARKLPGVLVEVARLDELPPGAITGVPATPSYFLDDRLLFLGNPRLDELVAKIVTYAGKGRNDRGPT